ncbi:hypothetical protein D3C80_935010 [compost metagenome]
MSSSNTGSTDLRDTDVQQPNTTATLSWVSNCRPFSANSGQFDAGSTTTGSSNLPLTPPLALICSMVIKAMSLSDVSEIAMVPDSECRMPTLMVSAAWMLQLRPIAAMDALRVKALIRLRRFIVLSPLSSNVRVRQMATSQESFSKGCAGTAKGSGTGVEGTQKKLLHRPGA